MNDEMEKMWKEAVVVSCHFPGGAEENRITGVPAEIRTDNIPNTCVNRTKFHSTLKPRYNTING
jgi:hypothetical protein